MANNNYWSTVNGSFTADQTITVPARLRKIPLRVSCFGTGDIIIRTSANGTDYGTDIRIMQGEVIWLRQGRIQSIELEHTGTNSGYTIYADGRRSTQ